jgi:hypothetical protein
MDKFSRILLVLTIGVVATCAAYSLPSFLKEKWDSHCVEECHQGSLYLVCRDTGVVQMLEGDGDSLYLVGCNVDKN